MRHTVGTRTRQLVQDLHDLAAEVESYLHFASQAARSEWRVFQSRWPSDHELRQGAVSISDDALANMAAKLQRFLDILRAVAQPHIDEGRSEPGPVRDWGLRQHDTGRLPIV